MANDSEVRLPILSRRPDPVIARDIVAALKNELPDSLEQIKVVVTDGRVSLEGEVEWNYQRQNAEAAIRLVRGVRHIKSAIKLSQTPAAPSEIQQRIQEALLRSAEVDASRVKVEIERDTVILRGKVRSWAEREEAERAVWTAPGILHVENQIIVSL